MSNSRTRYAALAILGLVAAMSIQPGSIRAQDQTPVGLWRTFDDRTGKERGTVRITEEKGALYGNVVSTADPADRDKRCISCTDERRDQPIIGLGIIRSMHRDGDKWTGGDILDPETGSVYRCSIRLEDDGRKLIVRGYRGVSLLGRSQTWLRAG